MQRQGYDSYFDLQESLKISFEQKLKVVNQKMKSGSLLDIGCAYGTFLETASRQFNCFGLEISKYAAHAAREIYCVKTIISNIEQSPFLHDHFDVVTMWDVIEHLRYPISALKEVHRLLKPGGYCFISTDNIDSWLVKFLGKSWWSFAPPLHLCHFSIKSLKIAVQQAGGYDICETIKDQRIYKLNEIIKHFGVAYQNGFLQKAADLINNKQIGRLGVSINRPEQFILVLKKQSRSFGNSS
jgi:2-polyprenyl-3-methyl-5-hydroxy-6-metoxy-1,4-benzoquinol methylase